MPDVVLLDDGARSGETFFDGGFAAWTVMRVRQSRTRAMGRMGFIRVVPGGVSCSWLMSFQT